MNGRLEKKFWGRDLNNNNVGVDEIPSPNLSQGCKLGHPSGERKKTTREPGPTTSTHFSTCNNLEGAWRRTLFALGPLLVWRLGDGVHKRGGGVTTSQGTSGLMITVSEGNWLNRLKAGKSLMRPRAECLCSRFRVEEVTARKESVLVRFGWGGL